VGQVIGRDGEVGREMEEKEFCAELSWGWGSLCLAPLLASRAVRGYPTLTLRPRRQPASKQAGRQSKAGKHECDACWRVRQRVRGAGAL
jgi:hypothetical protein